MHRQKFDEFICSDDTLRVYEHDQQIYNSNKSGLLPLLEYISNFTSYHRVVVFDKLMGNAAALLAVKANCSEVFSPMGSQIAIDTLNKYGISHQIIRIIPNIQKPDGLDMCPMEKLSLNKGPEDFYNSVNEITNSREWK
ncbi:DUF1893 domain-containing protein [Chloroflexota bacterium]